MTEHLTTSSGAPLGDNEHSLTAGVRGPLLMQDYQLIDKLAHFVRERIPERIVHAKGAGAFGYFETTHDLSALTKAHLFGKVGRRTPLVARFSTVGGERGSADAERDPRGFAVKFYTEEGNYDVVGNNTPVFFIRDPFKFPDMVHTHKRNPASGLKDHTAFWDFFSRSPEATHQVTVLFSDRGIPANHRHMHGFGCHTYRWVNARGEGVWMKYHFRTEAGIKNLTSEAAAVLAGSDPDHASRDLWNHIAGGGVAAWKVEVQIMPEADAERYRIDPFDVTKVWRYQDYPLRPLGRMVLDRNPANNFADMEQVAFSPSNLIPGIKPSPDKLLQGRLFSYPDAHRYRLGANFQQIPVNRAQVPVHNHFRDGAMTVDGNGGGVANYHPNSFAGPVARPDAREAPLALSGVAARTPYPQENRCDDFEQAGLLWQVLKPDEQTRLVRNLAGHMNGVPRAIQARMVGHFMKAHADYGGRLAGLLGLSAGEIAAAKG